MKEWLSGAWAKVAAGFGLVIGVLWFFLSLKNKKVAALEAQIDLADTQKAVDLVEVEIKQKTAEQTLLKKEVEEHDRLLAKIEEKRQALPNAPELKPNEIEDYWK